MPVDKLHLITMNYDDQRDQFIEQGEGTPGQGILQGGAPGAATIGYGFDLRFQSMAEIQAYLMNALGVTTLSQSQQNGLALISQYHTTNPASLTAISQAQAGGGRCV